MQELLRTEQHPWEGPGGWQGLRLGLSIPRAGETHLGLPWAPAPPQGWDGMDEWGVLDGAGSL